MSAAVPLDQPAPRSPPALGLTPLQRWALLAIEEWVEAYGVAPSVRELAAELELRSHAQAHGILCALRDRGHIAWRPGCARSVAVIAPLPMPEPSTIEPLFAAGPGFAEALAREQVR